MPMRQGSLLSSKKPRKSFRLGPAKVVQKKMVPTQSLTKNQQIAHIILQQLGGNKFIAMTGAKNLVATDKGLTFRLPGGGGFAKKGINMVHIQLMPSDTYNMSFFKLVKGNPKFISQARGVYNSDLQRTFKEHTGLDTHL